MITTVAGIPFDHHRYDERSDVLYLNVGESRPAVRGLETSEGHAIHYDESGAIIAITLLNVRRALEREGHLTLSLPAEHLAADEPWPILTADEERMRSPPSASKTALPTARATGPKFSRDSASVPSEPTERGEAMTSPSPSPTDRPESSRRGRR